MEKNEFESVNFPYEDVMLDFIEDDRYARFMKKIRSKKGD